MPGALITLEGIEGSGKTTHQAFIASYLSKHQKSVINTREPGGCEVAEQIRHIVLNSHTLSPLTETLLFFAARREHIEQVITPALNNNQWVVSDRFIEASFAYQGGGRGIDQSTLNQLTHWTLGALQPTLTLLFDIDMQTSQKRIQKRPAIDRIEQETPEFFHQVRAAYLKRAAQQKNVYIIDATQTIPTIENTIMSLLDDMIKNHP